MADGVLALLLLDFALIGLLPLIFFRRGRLGAAWWLSAGPYVSAAALLVAARAGLLAPVVARGPGRAPLELVATLLGAGSIALIAYTLGTHRTPVALWHQPHDTPTSLVTHGAYARIRHPFYAAFLLALLAALAFWPHPAMLLTLGWGAVALTLTARREERRLLRSAFGAEYAAYLGRTGRFWPRLGGGRA